MVNRTPRPLPEDDKWTFGAVWMIEKKWEGDGLTVKMSSRTNITTGEREYSVTVATSHGIVNGPSYFMTEFRALERFERYCTEIATSIARKALDL